MLAAVLLTGCQGGGAQGAASAVPDGRAVYAARCAKCHGESGQGGVGPRLVPGDRLGGHGTAQGLYDYLARAMPGDAPASLPADQYWAVVNYLVVTNGFAAEGTVVGPGNASDIRLTP